MLQLEDWELARLHELLNSRINLCYSRNQYNVASDYKHILIKVDDEYERVTGRKAE